MTISPSSRRNRLLPELELEVMKVLWRRGTATVADVHSEFQPRRPLAYTTVMTVLERLTRKQATVRKKEGRGYRYTPILTREAACELAVDRLLRDFFSDSPERLAAYLTRKSRPEGMPVNGFASEALDSSLL